MINDKQNIFNASAKLVPLTRETLAVVDRVGRATLHETLKALNGDQKPVKWLSVLFSNTTDEQSEPTGPFHVIAIFGPGQSIAPYALMEHESRPWATLRVLELFEGGFQSFVEYSPKDDTA